MPWCSMPLAAVEDVDIDLLAAQLLARDEGRGEVGYQVLFERGQVRGVQQQGDDLLQLATSAFGSHSYIVSVEGQASGCHHLDIVRPDDGRRPFCAEARPEGEGLGNGESAELGVGLLGVFLDGGFDLGHGSGRVHFQSPIRTMVAKVVEVSRVQDGLHWGYYL